MHKPKLKLHNPAVLFFALIATLLLALPQPGNASDNPPINDDVLDTIDPKGALSGEYTFALEEIEDENGMTTIVVTISDAVAEPLPVSDTERFRRELEATLISMLWGEDQQRAASQPAEPPSEQYASNGVFPDLPRSMLPEPATLALIGLGLACLFLARCKFSG